MSQQGPILVVSTAKQPAFASALDVAKVFPIVETQWADAARAVEQVQPAAVLAAASEIDATGFAALAARIASRQPYLPLIVVDPQIPLPDNAIPFFQTQGGSDRLMARLRAALRIRSLHATVMRRLVPAAPIALSHIDPARDATVLLVGRGGAYPALSVSLGERTGVVGALSIEAAARHLNVRDIDGIVLGEGFGTRVIDAFLTVLTEDARFRNLPIVVTAADLAPTYDLPNLEIISGDAEQVVATLARYYMPEFGYVVFAGALISAILSNVHSSLHAPAAQVSHNVILKARPYASSEAKLRIVRMTVLLLSVVAFLLALSADRIKDLVEIASAFGSAGVVVTALFAVFTRIGGPASAGAAIVIGVCVWALGSFGLGWKAPYITAIACSAVAYLAVAWRQGKLRGV